MAPPLKRHHLAVLKVMYDLHVRNPEWVWTFNSIAECCESEVAKSDVRRIVRFLKRRGYVEYTRAFSEDDYKVNGSGHMITHQGITHLKDLP